MYQDINICFFYGSKDEVIDILKAYQNDDGDFVQVQPKKCMNLKPLLIWLIVLKMIIVLKTLINLNPF